EAFRALAAGGKGRGPFLFFPPAGGRGGGGGKGRAGFSPRFLGRGGGAPAPPPPPAARNAAPRPPPRNQLQASAPPPAPQRLAGEVAVLDWTVERSPDGSFVESGTIAYGAFGTLTFETVGRGTVGPSPLDGWVHGAVMWKVTAGTGHLVGARGLITSNFVASA